MIISFYLLDPILFVRTNSRRIVSFVPPLVRGSIAENQEQLEHSKIISVGWFTFRQDSAGSPVPARGETVGKTCPMSFRLLGSRSTGGIALRGAGTSALCSTRGDDSTTVDFPSPPLPTRIGNRDLKVEGKSTATDGGEVYGLREGGVEEGAGRRANTSAGGSAPSPGRGDTSGILVNTGVPALNVSDWSLQSCDDTDDGAVRKKRNPSIASHHDLRPHLRADSPLPPSIFKF